MHKGLRICGVAATLSALVLLPGCKIDPNQVIALAAYNGVYQGLRQWSKKHPVEAAEAATALSKNLRDDVLPYLNGAELKPSEEIDAVVASSLFRNVPEDVKDLIVIAASVLDEYLPIPSAQKLKPEQLGYIKTFCMNVAKGCDDFLRKSAGMKLAGPKDRRWLNGVVAK